MITEPKIIPLSDSYAVTAERMLCFVPKDEDPSTLTETIRTAAASFASPAPPGLPFRADDTTLSVTVIPTQSCNLQCIYCYSDGGQHRGTLDLAVAVDAFDALCARFPETQRVNLFFAGGGEPFLNFPVMRDFTDYVSKKRTLAQLRVVTNGTVVRKHLPWLGEHNGHIRISYDGSSQDITRPGRGFSSADQVHETLTELSRVYPMDRVSVQITVTSHNVSTIASDVCRLAEQYGVGTFKIEPVQTSCSSRAAEVPSPAVNDFVACIIDTLRALRCKELHAFVDTSYLSVPSTEYFCSLRNKMVICPDGILSPCVEVTRRGVRDDLILWDTQNLGRPDYRMIEQKQQASFASFHARESPVCSRCEFVHFCKANCPMRQILDNRGNGPFPLNCRIAKALIPMFLDLADKDEAYLRLVYGDSFNAREECF